MLILPNAERVLWWFVAVMVATIAPCLCAADSDQIGNAAAGTPEKTKTNIAASTTPGSTDVGSLATPSKKGKPLFNRSPVAGPTQTPQSQASTGAWVLKTLGALGLVIALVLVLRVILQRFNKYTPGGAEGMVEVLGRSGIGPKTNVLFLRIDRRIVVVAQGSTGLDTLVEITDPQEVAALMARFASARPKSLSEGFRGVLQRFDKDHTAAGAVEVEASVVPDEGRDGGEQYIDRTRDRLGDLLSRVRSFGPEGGGS